MKNKSFYIFILTAILSMFFIIACEEDGVKDGVTISQIKEFISIGGDDGYIENLPTRVVHNYYAGPQGKSLNIGWNGNGFAMRGFISFDVSDMFPTANKELVIDEAVLSVYETNTNMHPFNGLGVRAVNCYLLDYGDLDKSDFALTPFADCGTITTWGYNVLKEYPLTITSFLKNYHQANPTNTKFQFRLQFVPDENVNPPSPLTTAMWNVFSGDETQKTDYRPKLMIKYHYRDK